MAKDGFGNRSAKRHVLLLIGLVALLFAAWFVPPHHPFEGMKDYLPLHIILESFSIVVAFMVFGVAWNAYSTERPAAVTVLGCALLAVGLIDFVHMLSYAGMPDFITPSDPEKAINFWLAARLIAALAFLAVAFGPSGPFKSPTSRRGLLVAALGVTALVAYVGLFRQRDLPHTFIEGQGLTPLKIGMEYLIVALLVPAAAAFYRRAGRSGPFDAGGLFAATAVTVLSELAFTLYTQVTDIYNLLGHAYKGIAYLFIYRVVFVGSVREPFERLAEARRRQERQLDDLRRFQKVAVGRELRMKELLEENERFKTRLADRERKGNP